VAEQTLVGLAAGAFLVSAYFDIFVKRKEYEPISRASLVGISAPAMVIAMIVLVAELGRPERAPNAALNTMVLGTSVMSLTVPFLGIFTGIAVLTALLSLKPSTGTRGLKRWLQIIGIIFAVPSGMQAGLLLQAATQRHFWESPIFPYIYLISGVLAGMGAVGLLMLRRGSTEFKRELTMLTTYGGFLILILIIAIASHIAMVYQDASFEVGRLMAGAFPLYAPIFYVGVLVLGIVVPGLYALKAVRTGSIDARSAKIFFALLIIGAIAIRVNFLYVGQAISLPY